MSPFFLCRRMATQSFRQEYVFSRLPESWVEVNSNSSKLTFCHIVNTSLTTPVIKYSLTINETFHAHSLF